MEILQVGRFDFPRGEPLGMLRGEPSRNPHGQGAGRLRGNRSGSPRGEPLRMLPDEPSGNPHGQEAGRLHAERSGGPHVEPLGMLPDEPPRDRHGERSGRPHDRGAPELDARHVDPSHMLAVERSTDAAPGDVVRVRDAIWRVAEVRTRPSVRLVRLVGADDGNRWQRRTLLEPFDRVRRVTGADRGPRLVSRARWMRTFAALLASSPSSSSSSSSSSSPSGCPSSVAGAQVTLMPHQIAPLLAVLGGRASRLLLADAVGLGKTIQAALLLRELRARGAANRVLILVPPGLRDQWQHELSHRAGLPAAIVDANVLAARVRELPPDVNPWTLPGIHIASLDFMKQAHVMRGAETIAWDVLIVDEAHGLSEGTDRVAAVDTLARHSRHVLLLTATPHHGSDQAFAALCRIGCVELGDAGDHTSGRPMSPYATRATHATHATRATDATYATHATHATNATNAIDGSDGSDGSDAIDAADAADAADGIDEIDGMDGIDGIDATDGIDGIDAISASGASGASGAIDAMRAIDKIDDIEQVGVRASGRQREPERQRKPAGRRMDPIAIFRRTRAAIGLPMARRIHVLRVARTKEERWLDTLLARYARRVEDDRLLLRTGDSVPADSPAHEAASLALSVLLKRASSSASSLERSLRRRLALLEASPESPPPSLGQPVFDQPGLPFGTGSGDDGAGDGDEVGRRVGAANVHADDRAGDGPEDGSDDPADRAPDEVLRAPGLRSRRIERAWLKLLIAAAHNAGGAESKLRALVRWLRRTNEPALIYTEYRDTLEQIARALQRSALQRSALQRSALQRSALSPRRPFAADARHADGVESRAGATAHASGSRAAADVDAATQVDAGQVDATLVGPPQVDPAQVDAAARDAIRIDAGQVDAAQINATQVGPGQIDPAQVEADARDAILIDAGHVDAAQIDAAEVDPAQVDPGQVDAAEVNGVPVDASQVDAGKTDATQVGPAQIDRAQIDPAATDAPNLSVGGIRVPEGPPLDARRRGVGGADETGRPRACGPGDARATSSRARVASTLSSCAILHGGLGAEARRAALGRFLSGEARLLLTTDAAGEGLNLQQRCRVVLNVELPWNPNRLEQRIGRVDRLGQTRTVHAVHLVAAGTAEDRMLDRLTGRVRQIAATLGDAPAVLKSDRRAFGPHPPASAAARQPPATSALDSAVARPPNDSHGGVDGGVEDATDPAGSTDRSGDSLMVGSSPSSPLTTAASGGGTNLRTGPEVTWVNEAIATREAIAQLRLLRAVHARVSRRDSRSTDGSGRAHARLKSSQKSSQKSSPESSRDSSQKSPRDSSQKSSWDSSRDSSPHSSPDPSRGPSLGSALDSPVDPSPGSGLDPLMDPLPRWAIDPSLESPLGSAIELSPDPLLGSAMEPSPDPLLGSAMDPWVDPLRALDDRAPLVAWARRPGRARSRLGVDGSGLLCIWRTRLPAERGHPRQPLLTAMHIACDVRRTPDRRAGTSFVRTIGDRCGPLIASLLDRERDRAIRELRDGERAWRERLARRDAAIAAALSPRARGPLQPWLFEDFAMGQVLARSRAAVLDELTHSMRVHDTRQEDEEPEAGQQGGGQQDGGQQGGGQQDVGEHGGGPRRDERLSVDGRLGRAHDDGPGDPERSDAWDPEVVRDSRRSSGKTMAGHQQPHHEERERTRQQHLPEREHQRARQQERQRQELRRHEPWHRHEPGGEGSCERTLVLVLVVR